MRICKVSETNANTRHEKASVTSSPTNAAPKSNEPPRGAWPRAAASGVVFRDAPGLVREVLLIERGKGAMRGVWSLPGGHVEPGETVRDAARREIDRKSVG